MDLQKEIVKKNILNKNQWKEEDNCNDKYGNSVHFFLDIDVEDDKGNINETSETSRHWQVLSIIEEQSAVKNDLCNGPFTK